MYRQIIVPTEQNHTIELPESFFGKEVEVLIKEVTSTAVLPTDLKDKKFWDDIVFDPSFPSIEEIRAIAWPTRSW